MFPVTTLKLETLYLNLINTIIPATCASESLLQNKTCWVGFISADIAFRKWGSILYPVINKTKRLNLQKENDFLYLKYLLFFHSPVIVKFWCSLGSFIWYQSRQSTSLGSSRFEFWAAGENECSLNTMQFLKIHLKHWLSAENKSFLHSLLSTSNSKTPKTNWPKGSEAYSVT